MHTSGPLRQVETYPDEIGTDIVLVSASGVDIATVHNLQHVALGDMLDNANLIQWSWFSYDRNCGANAVQCAEEDLLGQALEALKSIATTMHGLMLHLEGAQFQTARDAIYAAIKILDKVKGS